MYGNGILERTLEQHRDAIVCLILHRIFVENKQIIQVVKL